MADEKKTEGQGADAAVKAAAQPLAAAAQPPAAAAPAKAKAKGGPGSTVVVLLTAGIGPPLNEVTDFATQVRQLTAGERYEGCTDPTLLKLAEAGVICAFE